MRYLEGKQEQDRMTPKKEQKQWDEQDQREQEEMFKKKLSLANQGNAQAQNYVARCYKNNFSVKKDAKEAVKWYRKAAEQGHADAQYNLGLCYLYGSGVEKDEEKGAEWYKKATDQWYPIEPVERYQKAAKQGDAIAQFNLGVCYWEGKGVVKNEIEAVLWYRKAAEQGHAHAQNNLGWHCEVSKNEKAAVKYYQLAAAKNNAYGQANLGRCYRYGLGVEKNLVSALCYYQQAAMQGHERAQNVVKDLKEEVVQAAKQGDAVVQFNLGVYYWEGKGVVKDEKEAARWYRKAAEQGHAAAQNNLGWCFENGNGVTQNVKESVKYYQLAAAQGNMNGQANLGRYYLCGRGVEENLGNALYYFKQAAMQGDEGAKKTVEELNAKGITAREPDATAQFYLGECFEYGKRVVKNEQEAVRWYQGAAKQGHAAAQCSLGVCYWYGKGIKKDEQEALQQFQKAAEQGFADAQYNLGQCYLQGIKKMTSKKGHALKEGQQEKDEQVAVQWYRKAANQGHTDAQYNLGVCYEYGLGIEKDLGSALYCYQQAAEQKNEKAQKAVKDLIEKDIIAHEPKISDVTLSAIKEIFPEEKTDEGTSSITLDHKSSVKNQLSPQETDIEKTTEVLTTLTDKDLSGENQHPEEKKNTSQEEKEKQEKFRNQWLLAQDGFRQKGDRQAQYYIGQCFADGIGVKKDEKEAVKWYGKAANQSHPDAQYHLGKCYECGKGVEKNKKEAVRWYHEASKQKQADAQCSLGECFENYRDMRMDKGVIRWIWWNWDKEKEYAQQQENREEAVRWYQKAAEQGHSDAQYHLGRRYGCSRYRHKEAVCWYQKAAKQGHADAQYELAECYKKGQGVAKNQRAAAEWYRKAVEQGHTHAKSIWSKYVEGIQRRRKRAEQGDIAAQCDLGTYYYNGEGVEKDEKEAAQWFKKAAEQGYADAQHNLSLCYMFDGVVKNEKEAVRWCRKAANQGYVNAQYRLGSYYEHGLGVEKDLGGALYYYQQAATQGHEEAQKRVKDLVTGGISVHELSTTLQTRSIKISYQEAEVLTILTDKNHNESQRSKATTADKFKEGEKHTSKSTKPLIGDEEFSTIPQAPDIRSEESDSPVLQGIECKSYDKEKIALALLRKSTSKSKYSTTEEGEDVTSRETLTTPEFKRMQKEFKQSCHIVKQQQQRIEELEKLHATDPIALAEMKEIDDKDKDSILKDHYNNLRTNLYEIFIAAIAISSGQVKVDAQLTTLATKGLGEAITYAATQLGAAALQTIPVASILGSALQMAGTYWVERGIKIDLRHISKLCQVNDCTPFLLAKELARKITRARADTILHSLEPQSRSENRRILRKVREELLALMKSWKKSVSEALSGQSKTPMEQLVEDVVTELVGYAITEEFKGYNNTRQEIVDRALALLDIPYTPPNVDLAVGSTSPSRVKKLKDSKDIEQQLAPVSGIHVISSHYEKDSMLAEISSLKQSLDEQKREVTETKQHVRKLKQENESLKGKIEKLEQDQNAESNIYVGDGDVLQAQVKRLSTTSHHNRIFVIVEQIDRRMRLVEQEVEIAKECLGMRSEESKSSVSKSDVRLRLLEQEEVESSQENLTEISPVKAKLDDRMKRGNSDFHAARQVIKAMLDAKQQSPSHCPMSIFGSTSTTTTTATTAVTVTTAAISPIVSQEPPPLLSSSASPSSGLSNVTDHA